jgi:peptide/nickel transport system permease protein
MKFLVHRLLLAIPTLLIVLLLSFLLMQLVPGDPARVVAGDSASPQQLAAVRAQLGIDRPLLSQLGTYFSNVARGDLGTSLQNQQSVTTRIADTLPVTLSLTAVAMIFTALIAVPLGVLAALRRGRWADRAIAAVSAFLIAIPPFVVGLVLVVIFALHWSLFPATGYVPVADGFTEWLRALALPALALALTPAAELTRQLRGSLVDTLEQDFIRTVRAKGMPSRSLVGKHAAKNAATPVITIFGLQMGRILGGAVVIDLIFGLPGFGTLAYNAVLGRDFPLIQGVVLVSAVAVILCNLLVDLSYTYLNPKLRTTR